MRPLLLTIASLALAAAAPAAGAHGRCRLHAADAAQAGTGCARAWMDRNLRLNDLMTVGTHNSYKQAITPKLFAMMLKVAPKAAPTLEYHHPDLTKQLEDGARGLELDVVYDPQGGRFAHPLGPVMAGEPVAADYAAAMSRPGYKVLHVQDIDFRSSCLTFVQCLTQIRGWSRAHPDHTPILITMNAKDDASPMPGGPAALTFDDAAYAALDAEIRSVFHPGEVITPDIVQGLWPTLREAVLHGGWPTLGASRGKVMFALDEDPAKVAVYRGRRRSLEGRMLFINTDEASPAAAYLTLNEASDAPASPLTSRPVSWCEPAPTPTRSRRERTTLVAATGPWPPGRSTFRQTIAIRKPASAPIRCGFRTGRSRSATPNARHSDVLDLPWNNNAERAVWELSFAVRVQDGDLRRRPMIIRTAKTALAIGMLAATLASAGCASEDYAQPMASNSYANDSHYAGYGYYADQCQRVKQNRNVAGTVIGAVAGGLLGNAVSSGGGKTGGTIIGAAAGAAVGSNVARSSINCDNGRPYFSREQTADYDSYQGYRGQHDDAWYRQHDCRWVRSDRDDYIRVCRGRNDNYYPEY